MQTCSCRQVSALFLKASSLKSWLEQLTLIKHFPRPCVVVTYPCGRDHPKTQRLKQPTFIISCGFAGRGAHLEGGTAWLGATGHSILWLHGLVRGSRSSAPKSEF